MNADIRLALRQLRKAPGFALTAVLTLALAIGANAIVFSVLNALVLRPLNVPHPESLFMVERAYGSETTPSQSYPDYRDLRDRNHSFDSLVTYDIMGGVGLDTGHGNPSVIWPYMVSGNYFDALGIQPYLGRFIHASEEHGPDSVPEIVLSYALWHSHFNSDPAAVGRTVEINKHPFTIVGVAPRDFRGTELFFAPDFWVPIVNAHQIADWDSLEERGNHNAWVIGHLKPGVTPAAAASDLNTIAASLAKTYPKADDGLKFSLSRPGLAGNTLAKPTRAFMFGLMLLAGLILLAACANLGSLFAARAADRSREIAVRMALGSRRQLILRQLLTEAVLVSLAGGICGMVGAVAILRALSTWRPIPNIPINVPVNPDVNTYILAFLLAVFSGLFFGLVPVRQILRSDPWQIIRSGSTSVGSTRRFTLRDVLLGLQIAICAVLVTASLVAARGLERSLQSTYGIQPKGVMLVQTDLQMAGYDPAQRVQMQKHMLDAAATIPGVTAVGYADRLPLSLGGGDSDVYADTTTDYRPTNAVADAQNFDVSPDYFRAAGTALLAGRTFTMHDEDKAPVVAVVNREFARKVFGSVDKAIGGHFKFWGGQRAEVVGVVEDGKYETLTEDQKPAMFFSFLQHPDSDTWLVVRSQRDPQEIAAALQRSMRSLDPALPLEIKTWSRELDSALFASRVATVSLGVLGLLGAMLAITGIFGMAAYTVSKRLRELGIRIALGAGQRKVLGAALGRTFRLLAVGSIAGMILGVLATRVLSFIVYQATPKDPVILGGVILTMLGVGIVAALIPARRALAVDPMILLRDE
ncbi:ABC transporter permease [Alloacidobacterium sp.]|uniref:ABC transporter permease n=1 Tax=Alloacidobacterium sp. TaxID=2951999 RepID=UPI002D75488F|nr:ABC transporter permease [Alloacidobacterium sp.]HYK34483.1 ABC transporter permease [Alloacidobacterium sp.]